jgi:hypothetical protein
MQIMGVPGRAAVLRETAKGLDMDTSKVIPTEEKLEQMMAQQAQAAQEQQAMMMQQQMQQPQAAPV